jgi:hypothetical protein
MTNTRLAAWLFLAQGAIYLLIGALTPIMMNRFGGDRILFFSARSDAAYFGGDTTDLQQRDPPLAKLRDLLFLGLAGLLVALGAAVMAIAYFAVRQGQTWGYWSLCACGAMALAFWVMIVGKYVAAGAPVGLGDVPPFMWVTTLLWATGVVAGAVGLRT